ncbi:MAG TPA: SAM-dependent chlorinase/fluorinase [Candidatus Bathyarchaeia archaeon]|nr:SAM-dependent chlorinase/fluorinase [Candidatus Bathyarchaeia archaeon]
MTAKIITLTTDFGLRDPYVAEMKATILSISPDAVIVDVSHEIEKFNIRMGAYVLASVASHFPKGTVHVAVVDPSVGTQRRSLVIVTKQGFFVGPDNGILILAAQKQGITLGYEITNPRLMLPTISNTFHGRDVFAPAAAHLASGVPPASFGPALEEVVKPDFSKVIVDKGVLKGEVLYVDGFGNIVTNVDEKSLVRLRAKGSIDVNLRKIRRKMRLGKTYAEGESGEAFVLLGSQGYVEIAVNQGSAAKKFKVKPGDTVSFSRKSTKP